MVWAEVVGVWRQLGYAATLRDTYKVIMLDARGHGASDKPQDRRAHGLLNQVADVLAVLEALRLSKAHFLGYSMGGRIGLGLAKYAPERVESLIIGGTHPYADQSYVDAFGPLDGGDPSRSWLLSRGYWKSHPSELRPRLLANDCVPSRRLRLTSTFAGGRPAYHGDAVLAFRRRGGWQVRCDREVREADLSRGAGDDPGP